MSQLRRVSKREFLEAPSRYELRSGREPEAPLCPYGNHYQWIGYDIKEREYVRFTKSVFKILINKEKITR